MKGITECAGPRCSAYEEGVAVTARMELRESLRLIGRVCVQHELPAGDPPWLAAHIGSYVGKPRYITDRDHNGLCYYCRWYEQMLADWMERELLQWEKRNPTYYE